MTTMVWDETGTRYYETGVSHGIFVSIDFATVVPWNGLVAVNLDPQGGDHEAYYYDGVKYMEKILAEDFQATVQAISTPREFEACEGVKDFKPGVKSYFNKRDKFHMVWRTEIGSDEGVDVGYKWHIAYNCLVQPSSRAYSTIADTTTMDVRSFVITSTPACGRHSYFTLDSRDIDLTDLETKLFSGILPKCYELVPSEAECPSMLEDFEEYAPGQQVDDDKISDDGLQETYVYGLINNGLDTTDLPASGDFAANDSAASEVGTHPVLVDDDDATYITSADGDLGYTVGLPTLVGYVPGCMLELHIRISVSGDVDPDDPDNLDADAQVHISTDAGGDNTIGGFSDGTDEGMGFAITDVSGTPVDYVVPLMMDAWVNTTIDDVVAALEVGAFLNVVGISNNNPDTTSVVNVYEASVQMVNATEPNKSLRVITPIDSAWAEQHIYDSPGSDETVASNTVSIDFKLNEVADNSDVSGQVQPFTRWLTSGGDNEPGVFQIEANDAPIDYKPGDVVLDGTLVTNESIVGASAQWSDGDDATYAEIRLESGVDRGVAKALMPALSSVNARSDKIEKVTFHVRVASDASADFMIGFYKNYAGNLGSSIASASGTSSGSTITDFDFEVTDTDDLKLIRDSLSQQAFLVVSVSTATVKLRVYEAYVVIQGAPPLMRWLDDSEDDRGLPTLLLDTNVWYQQIVDWSFVSVRGQVLDRESKTVLWDQTIESSYSPICYVQHYAGMVGSQIPLPG